MRSLIETPIRPMKAAWAAGLELRRKSDKSWSVELCHRYWWRKSMQNIQIWSLRAHTRFFGGSTGAPFFVSSAIEASAEEEVTFWPPEEAESPFPEPCLSKVSLSILILDLETEDPPDGRRVFESVLDLVTGAVYWTLDGSFGDSIFSGWITLNQKRTFSFVMGSIKPRGSLAELNSTAANVEHLEEMNILQPYVDKLSFKVKTNEGDIRHLRRPLICLPNNRRVSVGSHVFCQSDFSSRPGTSGSNLAFDPV
jgi:hypothetical protein